MTTMPPIDVQPVQTGQREVHGQEDVRRRAPGGAMMCSLVLEALDDDEHEPPQQERQAMYRRYLPKSCIFSDAHAITIVTLDPIRTTVFSAASGTLSIV